MIQWAFDPGGGLVAKQEFKRPAVYLDHWAILEIAGDPGLATRFVEALKGCQGTWAVSLLNLMEYIGISDERQAAKFEALFDQALPNLFFVDFQVFEVMRREREMLEGGSRRAPYGDADTLSTFAHNLPDIPPVVSLRRAW